MKSNTVSGDMTVGGTIGTAPQTKVAHSTFDQLQEAVRHFRAVSEEVHGLREKLCCTTPEGDSEKTMLNRDGLIGVVEEATDHINDLCRTIQADLSTIAERIEG